MFLPFLSVSLELSISTFACSRYFARNMDRRYLGFLYWPWSKSKMLEDRIIRQIHGILPCYHYCAWAWNSRCFPWSVSQSLTMCVLYIYLLMFLMVVVVCLYQGKDELPDCCCWEGYANGWVFATWRWLTKVVQFYEVAWLQGAVVLAWYIRTWWFSNETNSGWIFCWQGLNELRNQNEGFLLVWAGL